MNCGPYTETKRDNTDGQNIVGPSSIGFRHPVRIGRVGESVAENFKPHLELRWKLLVKEDHSRCFLFGEVEPLQDLEGVVGVFIDHTSKLF